MVPWDRRRDGPDYSPGPGAGLRQPPQLDEAAASLSAAPIDVIAFGFTSSAYVIGAEGEAAMIDRLRQRSRGLPVVATSTAALKALRLLGCRSLALIHPPWFDSQTDRLGRRFYQAAGFAVPYAEPCGLPSEQKAITPAGLHEWVIGHVPDAAEALVIGGNGFRAVGVIAALESDLKRPVLTANQVLLWAALRAAGAETRAVTKYGRLFAVAG